MVFLFWEMNTPRNISFHTVLVLVCLGGTISLLVSLIGYDVSNLDWLGIAQAGIVEEVGKLLAVVLVCALGARNTRYRWILNGMVFGAAIGGGFALFETAGYAFFHGFLKNLTVNLVANDGKMPMDQMLPQLLTYAYQAMLQQIHGRAWTVPFGHILWTAISAGALWRVKGSQRFRAAMLFDPTFLRVFAIPVVAHGLWDAPVFEFSQAAVDMKYIVLGIVGWYVAFTLIQQGLRQIREAQLSATKSEYEQTQEILTTTGRFRSQQLV
jgi:RsiW-degrading membrane proteinase PrsW (M82 family)